MSDLILKIFATKETENDKTEIIKEQLTKVGFLTGKEIEFHGEHYLEPGDAFCSYFQFENEQEAIKTFKKDIRIQIAFNSSIMENDEGNEGEDPDFLDINNVVEIWNADGNFTNWDKLTDLLSKITGEEYKGEWDRL